MLRRERMKETEVEFDTSVWHFQLMPVEEMDIDEFIAMEACYSNEAPPSSQSFNGRPVEDFEESDKIFS